MLMAYVIKGSGCTLARDYSTIHVFYFPHHSIQPGVLTWGVATTEPLISTPFYKFLSSMTNPTQPQITKQVRLPMLTDAD